MSARMPTLPNALTRIEPSIGPVGSARMPSLRQARGTVGEIRITIERLGIDGLNLTSRQGAHVQDAVERELARLFQAQPLSLHGGAIAGLRAPPMSATVGADADALGAEIARSLFAALRDEASGGGR